MQRTGRVSFSCQATEKQMREIIRGLVFTCISLLFPLAALGKTATVDLLLQREHIGQVVIDDNKGVAYFEMVGGKGDGATSLPYANGFDINAALKSIYAVPLDGRDEAKPLFQHEPGAGYFFASNDPWSPNRRYLSVYKIKDRQVQPGVYDAHNSRLMLFEVSAGYHPIFSTFVWLSETEFIIATHESRWQLLFEFVTGSQAVFKRRQDAWWDGQAVAEVVGAGQYARLGPRDDFGVTKVDMDSVKISTLAEVLIGPVSVATKAPSSLAVQSLAHAKETGVWERSEATRSVVSLIDVSSGRKQLVAPISNDVRLLSWSASGSRFLIHRSVDVDEENQIERYMFSVVDTKTGEVVEDLVDGASNPIWVGDRLVYSIIDNLRYPMHQTSDLTTPARNSVAHEITTPPPIAASEDGVYYLVGGDVWHADFDGSRENLTRDYPHPITATEIAQRYELSGPIASTNYRARHLHEVLFLTVVEGRRYLLHLSESGHVLPTIMFPFERSQLLAATSKGAVFLTNEYGVGSQVHYVKAGAGASHRLLHHFNKHLASISPSEGPIRLPHQSDEGGDLYSWLYLPSGASVDNPKEYPMVVIPYAGTVYDDTVPGDRGDNSSVWDLRLNTNTPVEVFTSHGYAVLLPSIPLDDRGTAGNPMEQLVPPILSAVDAAVDTGLVDSGRLAISGHSYGGYAGLSTVVQTDRFHAVIAMAGPSNLIGTYGQFRPDTIINGARYQPPGLARMYWAETGQGRMGSSPWVDTDRYVRNSPLFFVDNIETPIMLIHGDLDASVLISQTEEMFTALYREGKDAVFIRYPGEHHGIEQPQNQRDMWQRLFDFLEDNGVTPGPKTLH